MAALACLGNDLPVESRAGGITRKAAPSTRKTKREPEGDGEGAEGDAVKIGSMMQKLSSSQGMSLCEVFGVLIEYLSIGEWIRLYVAFGCPPPGPGDAALFASRLGLQRSYTWHALLKKMNVSKRCSECGSPVACPALTSSRKWTFVCIACSRTSCYFGMMTRHDMYVENARRYWHMTTNKLRVKMRALPLAKRTRAKGHVYWRHAAMRVFDK